MGGRGSSSGLKQKSNLFDIPKVTGAQLKKLNRQQLETLTTAIYANRAVASGLSQAEGIRRAKLLMDGNTDNQLRKYIKKYGG